MEPALYCRRMGLWAVAIVISATFWTWLWGPLGLLLSTPLTMCLMVLGRHVKHLQFLEILLGEDADEAATEAESFLKENSLCCYYDDVVLKALALALAQAAATAGPLVMCSFHAPRLGDVRLALVAGVCLSYRRHTSPVRTMVLGTA